MKRYLLLLVILFIGVRYSYAQFNPMTMTPQDILNMATNSMQFEAHYYRDSYNRLVFAQSNTVTSDIIFALILGNREYWVTLQRSGTKDGYPYYPLPGTSIGVTLLKDEGRYFARIYFYSETNQMNTYKSFIDCSEDPNTPQSDRPSYCKANYKYSYPDPYAPFEPAFKALAEAQSKQASTQHTNGSHSNRNGTTAGTHECGLCNGTGRMIKNDASDFGQGKWCPECKKRVSQAHYHAPCISCGGKGRW